MVESQEMLFLLLIVDMKIIRDYSISVEMKKNTPDMICNSNV